MDPAAGVQRVSSSGDEGQLPKKAATKKGPLAQVASIFSTFTLSDPPPSAKSSREQVVSPRRRESAVPVSPRQEAQEPIGHIVEELLSNPSKQKSEEKLKGLSSEMRHRVRRQLEELIKQSEEKPKVHPAYPSSKPPETRNRSSSLEALQRLFSPPRVREMASPPKVRPTSPPRKDEKEKRPLSPVRERELNPPPRNVISPRREARAMSPPAQRRATQEKELQRPLSPPRARVVEPRRLHLSEVTAEQMSRAQELLRYMDALKVEKRKLLLRAAIEANTCNPRARKGEEVPLWPLLCLANESIIATHELFEIIQSSLAKKREHPISVERVESYLRFCCQWVQSNLQTKLFPVAQPYLLEIARLAKLHESLSCKALADRVLEACQEPPLPIAKQTLERSTSVSSYEFSMILDQITNGSLDKSYVAQAELVSLDLFLKLKALFQAMNPHDLIEKWPTKKNKSAVAFTNFFNGFNGFLLDTLLQKNFDAHKRACIVKFFVHVAFQSLFLGDLTTPMMIIAALDNVAVKKLQTTLKLLDKDHFDGTFLRSVQSGEEIPAAMTTLEAIAFLMRSFDPGSSWKKVRALQTLFQERNSFYIPYVPLIFSDLFAIGENNPKVLERDNCYNLEKLQLLQQKTAALFACRDLPLPAKISHEIYQTDLFLKVITENSQDASLLYAHLLVDDEARYQQAKIREVEDSANGS